MKLERKKVAVIFGGRSGEHVVSLRSAASVIEAVDPALYEVIPVGITREGVWFTGPDAWLALWENRLPREASQAILMTDPGHPGLLVQSGSSPTEWRFQPLDLAFPVLHGTYGEDGAIQGLFEMAALPYVGSGVLASSTAMDKVVMKILFARQGLPVAPYLYFYRWQWSDNEAYWQEQVAEELGFPCFVKPANLGSSVGITKCRSVEDFSAAVEEALLFDDKVLIEEYVEGREIECAVLGDLEPEASLPGEVIPCNEFYDYKAKYIDDRSGLVVPVELGSELENTIRSYSIKAFQAVEASGLARVDFFVSPAAGKIIVNEINTMPGFTSISMYPKMWEASGVDYSTLVGRLLELAMARFRRRSSLMVTPPE
jgi:D-alanine-D-alanine ligase